MLRCHSELWQLPNIRNLIIQLFHILILSQCLGKLFHVLFLLFLYVKEAIHLFQPCYTERGLVPFLTEFGVFQEAEQVREYLNLQFNQREAYLLNATIWNYDLYNTEVGKDNWNFENYSLLGPNRKPRNLDLVARPYPMRSSAEPFLVFFDIDSKYASIILKGEVISNEPTVVYIPFDIHYFPEFTICATYDSINEMRWDKENQLLHWYPSNDYVYNQLIIGKGRIGELDINKLPRQSKEIASKTTFTTTTCFS